ncbi:MAG: hypothetical protein ACI8VE_001568 [Natrialbaceae archaeon]|jgi:hypothetical protein
MSEGVSNGWDEEEDDGEELTAGDLFERLKQADDSPNVEDRKESNDLIDEEPEDVIAAADKSKPTPLTDEDLLEDTEALEDLLLSERTKEMGFLWVDTDQDAGETESEQDQETPLVENLDIDFEQISDEESVPEETENSQEEAPRERSPARPPLPILEEDPEAIHISNAEGDQKRGGGTDSELSVIEHFLLLIRRLF